MKVDADDVYRESVADWLDERDLDRDPPPAPDELDDPADGRPRPPRPTPRWP